MNEQKPRWIMGLCDLPQSRTTASYQLQSGKCITLKRRWRQMMDALRDGPAYCASPVRLSDAVHVLRSDYGVTITTETAPDGRKYYALGETVIAGDTA